MLVARKTHVIGSTVGGDAEKIITLHYNKDILSQGSPELERMLEKISSINYKHAPETVAKFRNLLVQQQRLTQHRLPKIRSMEGNSSPNPFG